jgi:peptidoglycan/LPS O-acetylase OafA/YrhL
MTQLANLAASHATSARPRTDQTQRVHELDYRPDVDGLRAVAVIAVVAFHAFPAYFPGGFIGVDVFFVISGFLISTIILKQLRRSTFTVADFYRRRIRRIFPALAIVLAACLLFGWYALLPDEFELLGKHVAAASVFVSNFVSWHEVGYFDRDAALKPLLHLWSLGIEEQFYLGWPLLLLLLKNRKGTGITISLLTAGSFALNIALLYRNPTANYYFPLSRFWELGLGCLLAYYRESTAAAAQAAIPQPPPHSINNWTASPVYAAIPVAGIVLIVVALFAFNPHTPFPGWAALLPTVGALCLLATAGNTWFQRRVMGHPAIVFIGLISYPLYLWHWPLLSFATILQSEAPSLTVRIVAVALSVALAALTYLLVELPIRRQRRPRVALGLAAGMATLGIAGLSVYAAAGINSRFDLDVRAIRQGPRTDALCLDSFPGARTGVVNYCKTTTSSHPAVLFMGDSRSQAIYDGSVAVLGRGYPLMLLGRGGCPPLLNVSIDSDSRERSCNDSWNLLVKYVRQVQPKAIVLVGGGSHYLSESASHASAFKQGLRNLIAALQSTSQVIYVREIPGYGSPPACFLRRIRLPGHGCAPEIPRSTVESDMSAYNRALDDIQREFPALRVLDSIPTLCGPASCSQRLGSGEIMYSDELHLSPAGARLFAANSGLAGTLVAILGPAR